MYFVTFFVYVVFKLNGKATEKMEEPWKFLKKKMETCCTNLEQGKSGIAIRLKGEMVT